MKITFLLPLCFVKFQQNTTYRLKQSLKTGKKNTFNERFYSLGKRLRSNNLRLLADVAQY